MVKNITTYIIIVVLIIGIILCVVAYGPINNYMKNHTPKKVISTPLPTMIVTKTPIINASPTPIINASPSATPISDNAEPDYNDYLAYLATHDVNGNATPKDLPNTISYAQWKEILNNSSVITTPILNGDPAYSNGVRIYDPKATPVPTPTPTPNPMDKYRITPIHPEDQPLIPDGSLDGELVGSLAWDASNSNVTPYAYQGDIPVFKLVFSSNCAYIIKNETIQMKVDRNMGLGWWQQITYSQWNVSKIIGPLIGSSQNDWAGNAPTSLILYEDLSTIFPPDGAIPKQVTISGFNADTSGRYRIQLWILVPDDKGVLSQACWISKEFEIISK